MKTLLWVLLGSLLSLPGYAQLEWEGHTLGPDATGGTDIQAADMDGDGDVDILGTSRGQDIVYLWENNQGEWITHIITDQIDGPNGIIAEDLDGDGDMDLASPGIYGHTVNWIEQDTTWVVHVIETDFEGGANIATGDFDGDGDPDLVSSSHYGHQLKWFENADSTWISHTISASMHDVNRIAVEDLDQDGDLDFATSSGNFTDLLCWWENDNGTFLQHIITQTGDSPWGCSTGDVDQDGDPDILTAYLSNDFIVWWENMGAAAGWTEHIVDSAFDGANGAFTSDIDGDGDMDIGGIARFDNQVSVWLNDGSQQDWEEQLVGDGLPMGWVATPADVDQDDDIDILSASYGDDEEMAFLFFEQLGSPGPVSFQMIAQDAPVVIPPEGGEVVYDVSLTSELPSTIPGVAYWTEIELPNGQEFGPLALIEFIHTPFMEVYAIGLTQVVPGLAPSGTYHFTGHLGFFPNSLLDNSFVFVKAGTVVVDEVSQDEMLPVRRRVPAENVKMRSEDWSTHWSVPLKKRLNDTNAHRRAHPRVHRQ